MMIKCSFYLFMIYFQCRCLLNVVLMFTHKRSLAQWEFYPLDVGQQTEVRTLILTHVVQCSSAVGTVRWGGDVDWENNNNIECGKMGK